MDSSSKLIESPFPPGIGQLQELISRFDWSETSLGPLNQWPQSLRAVTGFLVQSPLPIVLLWGVDGVMIYNDAYSVFAGARHPRLLGSKVLEGWPEVSEFNAHVMDVCMRGGTLAYKNQELTLLRNGRPEQVWMNLDYSPVPDDSGKPGGVIAIVVETSASVLADRQLNAQRDQLAQLFEQAPTFMAMLRGKEHRIELANPGYLQLVDNRPVIGLTVAEALPESVSQGYLELLDTVFESGRAFSANGYRFVSQPAATGIATERYVDFVYQPIKDATGTVIGIFIEGADVTERTLTDAALRESEARLRDLNAHLEQRVQERAAELQRSEALLRAIFETGFQHQGLLTPDGIIVDANQTSLGAIGKCLDDVIGMPFWESPWFAATPNLPEELHELLKVAATGTAVRLEVHLNLPEGGWRWFDLSLRPIVDSDGQVTFIVPEAVEFTDRRMAEEALLQSQKMEAVGQLTGGIAHDFNNLLTGICGSLQLIERRLAEGRLGCIERYIDMASKSASRAATLTQRLLAFSRRQTLAPQSVAVNHLIAGMEELIRRSVGPEIDVVVTAASDLWPTRIDPSQLENALLNLAINARDAMPDGGRITITTDNNVLDRRAAKKLGLPSGHYVSLSVSDSGIGMTPDVMSRAFDPFYTTKPLGQGTGLGLSMIHGFVHQSGGSVAITSEIGKGTVVTIYLPRLLDERPEIDIAVVPEPNDDRLLEASETVLLIDDEPAVRMLVQEVLEEAGFTVLLAEDGVSGLRILQSDVRIDLLLTDVGLPNGLNGRQVADAARVRRPDLKILFITGYAESSLLANGMSDAGMHLMPKPFSIKTLLQRIREVIDR